MMVGCLILIGMAWAYVFCGYTPTEGHVVCGMGAAVAEFCIEGVVFGFWVNYKAEEKDP